jgi:hypothetical protein
MTFALTERNHTVTKAYSFKKGDISLTFNLRVDKKGELVDFRALMTEALNEISKDIQRYENSK